MPTALLTGITSLANRGVEALVASTVAELRRLRPDFEVVLLDPGGRQDPDLLDALGVTPSGGEPGMPGRSDRGFHARALRRVRRTLAGTQGDGGVSAAIGRASVVIASGGDIFSSHYGGMQRQLRPLSSALRAGVPVVFLAQSIGPFDTRAEADEWLAVARRAALITVRERISYDYVVGHLGVPQHLVVQTADPAFLLDLPTAERLAEIHRTYGLGGPEPVVVIVPSQVIARLGRVDRQRHVDAWVGLMTMIRQELRARIVMISHVQGTAEHSDDSVMVRELLGRWEHDPGVSAAMTLRASEFKGLIAGADMVIAERMHAAIAGLSTGRCTVAVRYSVKADGIMLDVLGRDLADRLLIRIEDFLDPARSSQVARTAWEQRQAIADHIVRSMPRVRASARRNLELVSGLVPQASRAPREGRVP